MISNWYCIANLPLRALSFTKVESKVIQNYFTCASATQKNYIANYQIASEDLAISSQLPPDLK
jgi:hypothetical protein